MRNISRRRVRMRKHYFPCDDVPVCILDIVHMLYYSIVTAVRESADAEAELGASGHVL